MPDRQSGAVTGSERTTEQFHSTCKCVNVVQKEYWRQTVCGRITSITHADGIKCVHVVGGWMLRME